VDELIDVQVELREKKSEIDRLRHHVKEQQSQIEQLQYLVGKLRAEQHLQFVAVRIEERAAMWMEQGRTFPAQLWIRPSLLAALQKDFEQTDVCTFRGAYDLSSGGRLVAYHATAGLLVIREADGPWDLQIVPLEETADEREGR